MLLLFTRAAPPDAPYWPGRRWLAAADALAWPCVAWWALNELDGTGKLVVALAMALLLLAAGRRLRTALLANHRYRFTTWRIARVLAALLVIGAVLKWG